MPASLVYCSPIAAAAESVGRCPDSACGTPSLVLARDGALRIELWSADSMVSAARLAGAPSVNAKTAIAASAPRTPAIGNDCDRFSSPETNTRRVTTSPSLRNKPSTRGYRPCKVCSAATLPDRRRAAPKGRARAAPATASPARAATRNTARETSTTPPKALHVEIVGGRRAW